jgi:hypothetical protein
MTILLIYHEGAKSRTKAKKKTQNSKDFKIIMKPIKKP